jgi:hypothetical protein
MFAQIAKLADRLFEKFKDVVVYTLGFLMLAVFVLSAVSNLFDTILHHTKTFIYWLIGATALIGFLYVHAAFDKVKARMQDELQWKPWKWEALWIICLLMIGSLALVVGLIVRAS